MQAGMLQFGIFFIVALGGVAAEAETHTALVYKGPGSCRDGCFEAAAEMAERAGFRVKFVGPDETRSSVFQGASVWVQPGGNASQANRAMNSRLKENIRRFVFSSGGGYVGFCAGGFLATKTLHSSKEQGIGLLPGRSLLYWPEEEGRIQILPIRWFNRVRQMYWELGPYFKLTHTEKQQVEVVATYWDGSPATIRAAYGNGRVYVTGVHPEAARSWNHTAELDDRDNVDNDLAISMIKWVTD